MRYFTIAFNQKRIKPYFIIFFFFVRSLLTITIVTYIKVRRFWDGPFWNKGFEKERKNAVFFDAGCIRTRIYRILISGLEKVLSTKFIVISSSVDVPNYNDFRSKIIPFNPRTRSDSSETVYNFSRKFSVMANNIIGMMYVP